MSINVGIAGSVSVGKTTVLCSMANHAYMTGHNVLQIIFDENSKEDIKKKHYTKWTGISSKNFKLNKKDVIENISNINTNEYIPKKMNSSKCIKSVYCKNKKDVIVIYNKVRAIVNDMSDNEIDASFAYLFDHVNEITSDDMNYILFNFKISEYMFKNSTVVDKQVNLATLLLNIIEQPYYGISESQS
jgi:hypothetical protein